MQFHNLKRDKANKKSKQIGRGGTRGKTSGRGTKGQNARAGGKKRPEMRDIIKRLPKLRGRGKNFLKSRKEDYVPVKLSVLGEIFENKAIINGKILLEKGLVDSIKNGVKVLGGEELKKKLEFGGFVFSASAKEKILKAGGKIES